jgi:hypothetical protein
MYIAVISVIFLSGKINCQYGFDAFYFYFSTVQNKIRIARDITLYSFEIAVCQGCKLFRFHCTGMLSAGHKKMHSKFFFT